MVLQETVFNLKDGRRAVLRSPLKSDAEEMIQFLVRVYGETDFLLRYPEEFEDMPVSREEAFLGNLSDDPNVIMIACLVDGRIVGNAQISFLSGMKIGHRASVAITVFKDYWGLGIGTRLFEEMFRIARERGGIRQIELDYIEGNQRARALYEKMGFCITGVKPDSIRLKDGTFVNEIMMLKRL